MEEITWEGSKMYSSFHFPKLYVCSDTYSKSSNYWGLANTMMGYLQIHKDISVGTPWKVVNKRYNMAPYNRILVVLKICFLMLKIQCKNIWFFNRGIWFQRAWTRRLWWEIPKETRQRGLFWGRGNMHILDIPLCCFYNEFSRFERSF